MHRIPIPALPPDRSEYWLHHPVTEAALAALGDELVETLKVMLETPTGDVLTVQLRFQHEVNCWIASPARA